MGMLPSPLRRPVTTSTGTARALRRTLATSLTSAPAAQRAVASAQDKHRPPQTPATTCTATAPTSAAGSLMTSARRLAANAEEKPLDIPTIARKGPPVEFRNDDL